MLHALRAAKIKPTEQMTEPKRQADERSKALTPLLVPPLHFFDAPQFSRVDKRDLAYPQNPPPDIKRTLLIHSLSTLIHTES